MWKNLSEILIALIFILLLFIKLDPFGITMPNEVQMLVLCLLIATFGLYAGILFREKAKDEREAYHLYKASRGSYFLGITILVIGIVIKSLNHSLDPWLVYTLSAMVITKLTILVWLRIRN